MSYKKIAPKYTILLEVQIIFGLKNNYHEIVQYFFLLNQMVLVYQKKKKKKFFGHKVTREYMETYMFSLMSIDPLLKSVT